MMRIWRKRARHDAELDEEIRSHLAMAARDRVAHGESADEAAHAAQREFGNVTLVTEVTREMWAGRHLEHFVQDTRHAVRALARVPGFTAVAVLTLALGLGVNTGIFSVVHGVLLTPLRFPHPEQLVFISSQFPTLGFDQFPADAAEYLELRERNRSFADVGAYSTGAVNIGGEAEPARVTSAVASASLFHTLGVTPRLGRTFSAAETLPNGPAVAVLSSELWQSAFGARASIVGSRVDVDGVPTTVIGVMPPAFDVHDQGVKIWLPLALDPAQREQYRGSHYLSLVGRLAPGVTLTRARSELQTLLTQWAAMDGRRAGAKAGEPGFVHVPNPTTHRLRYDDLQADMVGSMGRALWVLQGAVVLVLLIACANLASLLLMRAETRHKELALRAALGAGRGRLVWHFMAESFVLSLSGAAVGLVLAHWGLRAFVAANAASIPRAGSVTIDGPVLLFTLLLVLATGFVFGLVPLLHLGTTSIGLTLREAGSRTTAGAARGRVRRALVVAETALAVMLVVGAGLLVRSFWKLTRVDVGFDRSGLTTFSVALPAQRYADSTRRVAFFEQLGARLAALPGVEGAAAMTGLPPRRQVNANDTDLEGYVPTPSGPAPNIDYYQYVTSNYLQTMRIPVVAGRSFTAGDGANAPPVAMINQTLARLFYKGENPIGRRIRPSGAPRWFTIVGIVKDVKQGGVDSKSGTELYLDYDQTPAYVGYAPRNMNVVIRSSLAPKALAGPIRSAVSALDPSLPVVSLRSMDDVFADAVSRPRFLTLLLGTFGGVALVLAAIGMYGVLAYAVTERRREIGIRMALGASERGVLAMVLGQGLSLAVIGLAAGLLGALGVTRLARSLLFGVGPWDPVTFFAVGAGMLAVALLACIIPARRATGVDPLVALRAD